MSAMVRIWVFILRAKRTVERGLQACVRVLFVHILDASTGGLVSSLMVSFLVIPS